MPKTKIGTGKLDDPYGPVFIESLYDGEEWALDRYRTLQEAFVVKEKWANDVMENSYDRNDGLAGYTFHKSGDEPPPGMRTSPKEWKPPRRRRTTNVRETPTSNGKKTPKKAMKSVPATPEGKATTATSSRAPKKTLKSSAAIPKTPIMTSKVSKARVATSKTPKKAAQSRPARSSTRILRSTKGAKTHVELDAGVRI